MASVYCHDSGVPEAAEKIGDLLEVIAREVAAARMPYIMGGDWQVGTQALADSGILANLRATVVCTGTATYFSGNVVSASRCRRSCRT